MNKNEKINIYVVGRLPEDVFIPYVNGYRGSARQDINYPVEFWETEHKIMDINSMYEELTKYNSFLQDINFARELRDVYNDAYPNVCREIIEVTFNNEPPILNGIFLGYDISHIGKSNILGVILYFLNTTTIYDNEFSKMLNLIAHSVARLLNENQLFRTYEDAKMVLSLIEGTCEIFGNLSSWRTYEVTGIYLVE